MADSGISYDNISLEIKADSQNAEQSVDKLTASLERLSTALKGVKDNSAAISKIATSLDKVSKVAVPDFSQAIQQFEALGSIDLSNLTNLANELKNLGNVKKGISGFAGAISATSKNTGASGSIYRNVSKVVDIFGDSVKSAFKAVKTLGSASLTGIKNLGGAFASLGQKGVQGIKTLVARLKELKNHTSGVQRLTLSLRNLLRVAIGFRGVYGVFNWLKEAVVSGADVAETNHIVEETFRDLSDDLKGWASDAIENYGIAANSAKRYAGTMSAMFQASGIGYQEAARISTDLVGLAGDLSSFYNIDTEEAFTKIRSGMTGMVRPLRALGIDLSVATLKEYALAQGITKSWTAMTQAEKVMLRYQYLMSATSKQQGDFQRTSASAANSMRIFRAYAAAIADALGEGLISALRHAVHALNFLMAKVLQVANVFKTFMQTLFGANISGGGFTLDTGDLEDASGYADDLSDSVDNAADGLSGASDSAEKLKKDLSVLPFDELNQLNKDQESSSSSSPSGGGGVGGLGDMGDLSDLGWLDQLTDRFNNDGLPDAINKWAEKIKAAFKAHAWRSLGKIIADGINEGLQKLYDILDPETVKAKVDPWINAFTTTFNSLIKYLDFDLAGRTLARGLNDLLYIINSTIESIDWVNLGRQLANGVNGLIDELDFGAVADFFANKLNVFWQTAYGFVTTFNWGELGRKFADGAWEFIQHIDWNAIIGTLNKGLAGIASTVKGFALTFPWKNAGNLLKAHVNDFINGFPAEEIGSAIGEALQGIEDMVLELTDPSTGIDFIALGEKLAAGLRTMVALGFNPYRIGGLISNLWNDAWGFLNSFIEGLKSDTGSGTFIGDTIRDTIAYAVEHIRVEDMASAISTFVNNVAQDIQKIFSQTQTWATLGTKIGNAISNILTGIKPEYIAGAINSVSDAISTFIGNAFSAITEDDETIRSKIGVFFQTIDWGGILSNPVVWGTIAYKLSSGILGLEFGLIKDAITTKLSLALAGIVPSLAPISAAIAGIAGAVLLADSAMREASDDLPGISEDVKKLRDDCEEALTDIEQVRSDTDSAMKQASVNAEVNARMAAPYVTILEKLAEKSGDLTKEEKRMKDEAIDKLIEIYPSLNDQISTQDGNLASVVDTVKAYIAQVEKMAYAEVYYEKLKDAIREQVEAEEALQAAMEAREPYQERTVEGYQAYIDLANAYLQTVGGEIDSSKTLQEQYEEALAVLTEYAGGMVTVGDASMTLGDAQDELNGQYAESINNYEALTEGITEASDAVEQASDLVGTYRDRYAELTAEMSGVIDGASGISGALTDANNKIEDLGGVSQESAANIAALFDASLASGDELSSAFATLQENWVEAGGSIEGLRNLIDTHLGEGMYDALIAATESATGKTDSLKSDIEETGKSAQDNLGKVETYNEQTNKTPTLMETIQGLVAGFASKILGAFPTESASKEAAEGVGTGAEKGINSTAQDAVDAAGTMADNMVGEFSDVATDISDKSKEIPSGVAKSIDDNAQQAYDAMERMKNGMSGKWIGKEGWDMHSPSQVMSDLSEGIPLGAAQGIELTTPDAVAAIVSLFDAIREETDSALDDLKSAFNTGGYDAVVYGFAEGISTGFEGMSLSGYVVDLATSFSNTVESEKWMFENAGYKIVSAIQSGLNSISLQLPHISVGWDTYTYGNGGWFELPYFNVHWYKKGGLFSDPRLIGIGEAGEEAVIPLTDKRAMARIADAITQNSNGVGMDQNALVAAFVQAQQIASQNNPQRDPVFEITVKTESDEVLARAVQRGNNSINYRSNSTPRYGY